MANWVPVTEKLPVRPSSMSDEFMYLVTIKTNNPALGNIVRQCHFSNNLSLVDKYDFPKKRYNRPGWYNYDGEYGFYEVTKVIAWMKEPEPYKEN